MLPGEQQKRIRKVAFERGGAPLVGSPYVSTQSGSRSKRVISLRLVRTADKTV